MRGFDHVSRFALRALFAGVLMAPLLAAVAPSSGAQASCWSWSDSEKRLARLHNRERGSRGIRKLRLDPELSKVARVHSREMDSDDKLYHTPSDVLAARVTNWRKLGENVGRGPNVARLHRMFMRSKSHRANILKSGFRHFGVGVRQDGDQVWVTVIFSSRGDPGTTLSMPSC
ncbi:MAG TPA: CAP domain-containing protein [Actinomycetota bacterium]|jgi:uncharacterized protein YkwD|nr:CAP domain-containing protein [Actinomycetota bacterium]